MANLVHSVNLLLFVTLALGISLSSACWITGGPCQSNADCCLGYTCGTGSTCEVDTEFERALTKTSKISVGLTSEDVDGSESIPHECYLYDYPVYSASECASICASYNFEFFEWNGFSNTCTCC